MSFNICSSLSAVGKKPGRRMTNACNDKPKTKEGKGSLHILTHFSSLVKIDRQKHMQQNHNRWHKKQLRLVSNWILTSCQRYISQDELVEVLLLCFKIYLEHETVQSMYPFCFCSSVFPSVFFTFLVVLPLMFLYIWIEEQKSHKHNAYYQHRDIFSVFKLVIVIFFPINNEAAFSQFVL